MYSVKSGLKYQNSNRWNFAKNNEEFKKVVSEIRAVGGTTNTKKALETALMLMQFRNKTNPTIVMVS